MGWESREGKANYEGEWRNDSMHGRGKQSWSDGRSYEGQFANGRFSGQGRMGWRAEKGVLVYEGDYKDDMKHGTGKFTWADGRIYDGEWKMGKRDGMGKYTGSNGEKKIGYWEANKWTRWADEANETPASAATYQATGRTHLIVHRCRAESG